MGFDIYGVAAKSERGEYFRNNIWWWRPMQLLISLSSREILTEEEVVELGINDGHVFSEEQALVIAENLSSLAENDEVFAQVQELITGALGKPYDKCFSKENVLEFIGFLKESGGFKVC